jgi:hypothetical protein
MLDSEGQTGAGITMDTVILLAIAAGVFLLIFKGGGIPGLGATTITSGGLTTPGAPGTGTIGQNLQQAAQASQTYVSQIQAATQQGSASTMQTEIGVGAQVASGVTTGFLATGAASTLGFATAGIGAVAGLAIILWQKHEVRMKDATNENAAWNTIYPDWISSYQQIIDAYNAGQLDNVTAAAELDSLRALVYQDAVKFQGMPGIDWLGGNLNGGAPIGLSNSQKIWQVTCNAQCTIGCCLFNGVVGPNTERGKAMLLGQPVMMFPAPGQFPTQLTNSFAIPAIPPQTKYGFNGAPGTVISLMR